MFTTRGKVLILGVALALVAAACGTMQSQPPAPRGPDLTVQQVGPAAPDRVLVRFRPGTPPDKMEALHRRVGGRVVQTIPQIGVLVVQVPSNTVQAAIGVYTSDPVTEFAEPDGVAEAFVVPNDPYFGSQWGPQKVEAPAAWDTTTGSNTVRIAVLDTGISQSHPDLAGKVVAAQNFTDSPTAEDLHGHGTHVAGTAAAVTNNAVGVAGMDWNARLMNGKVLGDNGSGYYSWVASGITWAADNGAKVIGQSRELLELRDLGGRGGSRGEHPQHGARRLRVLERDFDGHPARGGARGPGVDEASQQLRGAGLHREQHGPGDRKPLRPGPDQRPEGGGVHGRRPHPDPVPDADGHAHAQVDSEADAHALSHSESVSEPESHAQPDPDSEVEVGRRARWLETQQRLPTASWRGPEGTRRGSGENTVAYRGNLHRREGSCVRSGLCC